MPEATRCTIAKNYSQTHTPMHTHRCTHTDAHTHTNMLKHIQIRTNTHERISVHVPVINSIDKRACMHAQKQATKTSNAIKQGTAPTSHLIVTRTE